MAYASSYSTDPRLKRPASNPPDAPDPKRPALGIRESSTANANNNHGVVISHPNVTTPAPVAEMERESQKASILQMKTQINLQTIATMNLQLKFDHAEAQQTSAEADYQNNKMYYSKFPAMEETKLAAVDRAKKAFKAAREPLNSARVELSRLTERLVDLELSFRSASQDTVTRAESEELKRDASKVTSQDSITRAEFEELKNDIRKDITAIQNQIGSFESDVSTSRAMVDGLEANQKAFQQTVTKSLDDVRRIIESQAARVGVPPSNGPASVDSKLLMRLDTIESEVKDLELDIDNVNKAVAAHVESEIQTTKDALAEIKAGLQQTNNTVIELRTELERVEENTARIREAHTKGVEDQHTNAQTLQGCLDRLEKVGPLLDEAASKSALADVKNSLHALSDAVSAISAAQQKKSNGPQLESFDGVTSDLAVFQPVPGGDDEDDVSPFKSHPTVPGTQRTFDNKDVAHMKQELEAIKSIVQDQTSRYNNLLTDQLAQNMIDNLSVLYPNLKEAERIIKTVTGLQSRIGAAEASLDVFSGAVTKRLDVLDEKATSAQHSQDVQKLPNDLAMLSSKVDQHDKDIDAGRVQLQVHAAAIEKTNDQMRGVEEWITTRE